jgi:anti-sigma regulatory factor (Ser/Thr protein kinase)
MTSVEGVEPGRGPAALAASPTAAARLASAPDGQRHEWRLRAMESSIPSIRRELTAFLSTTGLSDDAFYDLLLAASEAASNAVDHPQDPTEPFFDVVAEIDDDGGVTIVVRDYGRWLEPTPSPYRGRGLPMMRVLADTIVTAGTHGTMVTIRNHRAAAVDAAEEGRAS